MATDYANYPVNPEAEATKDEITFSLTAFSNTASYTDLQAYALKLQELLLMEQGTNPAAVTMGIGIRSYLMEFLDSITITHLNSLVNSQQKEFLPSNLVRSMEFIVNGAVGDRNTLYLMVHINKENVAYANNYFAIGVGTDGTRRSEVISKILM